MRHLDHDRGDKTTLVPGSGHGLGLDCIVRRCTLDGEELVLGGRHLGHDRRGGAMCHRPTRHAITRSPSPYLEPSTSPPDLLSLTVNEPYL